MNGSIPRRCRVPVAAGVLLLAACQAPTPPAAPATTNTPQVTADTSEQPARSTDAPTAQEPATPAAVEPSAFVDRVWRVKESTAGEPGSTYAFLSDGTLVIDSPNGTPMHGKWSFADGALTMVEEGIPYRVDILGLDAGAFRIRSHNPGEPVDITLVPAPDVPLPKP